MPKKGVPDGPAAAPDRARDAQRNVDAGRLKDFSARLLSAAGLPADHAAGMAEALVAADLRGVDSHGVARLGAYVDALRRGMVNPRPGMAVHQRTPAVATLDGDNGLGFVVGVKAMDMAIGLAGTQGLGAVTVRHSNHFGSGAFYVARAAEAGFIGIALSNASPTVAPWGGRDPVLGTNPFAVGVPRRDGAPFIHDMATASIARGKLRLAEMRGEAIPDGAAVTAEGAPASTAGEALAGVLLPFGGAKGSGLSMLVDILSGVLSGAGFGRGVRTMYTDGTAQADVGHFFLALDVAAFMPMDAFHDRLEAMIGDVKAGRPGQGFEEVLIPGERAAREARRRATGGVPVDVAVLETLEAKARELGIAPLTP